MKKRFTKYITVIRREKVEGMDELLPVFGVDIYCNKKKEVKAISTFFNLDTTIEVCEIVEEQSNHSFDHSLN